MTNEQDETIKALLLRIEALERKVGIYGSHKFIDTEDFEEFIEKNEDYWPSLQNALRRVKKETLIGAMIGSKATTLLKIKQNVSKHTWSDITEDIAGYVREGCDNEFFRKEFFETFNRLIADGSIFYIKRDKNFNREEWLKEYNRKEEEQKKEQEAAEIARQERTKTLEIWKKEVFDRLDKN